MGLFGPSIREKDLEKRIDELETELNRSEKNWIEENDKNKKLQDILIIKEKTIDMLMKVNKDFTDEINIRNLVEMGYGEEEDLKTWFSLDMPGGRETGKDYIITKFKQMLKIHYMINQAYGSNSITDEVSIIIKNEHISNRMDELARINTAHYLTTSFEDWQDEFIMELKDNNIEYTKNDEYFITTYLVLETMFRAMILRM